MNLRRPSPSLVIALIALIVAFTSTAYAAVRITKSTQIKNGAVTGADVRNSSLTGADVRNKSLSGADLKENTISSTRLSSGVRRQLEGGGDSTAFETIRKSGPEDQAAGELVTIASLSVPAGAYAITAKTILTPILPPRNVLNNIVDPRSSASGNCTLDAAGDSDQGKAPIVVTGVASPSTIYMQITRTLGDSGTISLNCGSDVRFRASDTSIIATQVPKVTRTESGG